MEVIEHEIAGEDGLTLFWTRDYVRHAKHGQGDYCTKKNILLMLLNYVITCSTLFVNLDSRHINQSYMSNAYMDAIFIWQSAKIIVH